MRTLVFFASLFAISIVLFRDSFSTFFFQDDFFMLQISNIKHVSEINRFFLPRPDVQFYRPLSHELFFLAGRKLFGLAPLGFHLVAWIVWMSNIVLVYLLSKKYFHSRFKSYLLTTLYATSAIHYNSLFWIVNFSYILVTFWFFIGMLLLHSKMTEGKRLALVSGVYVLGLLSNEFMLTFPLIVILDRLVVAKALKGRRMLISILAGISGGYVMLRFLFPSDISAYPLSLKSILSSYRFFALYFLSWPETVKDNMVTWFALRGDFVKAFPTLVMFMVFSIVFCIVFCFRNVYPKNTQLRIFGMGFFWIIITLLPIVAVPSHISPHQGSIALFGFLIFLLHRFNARNKIVLYFFLVLWIGTTAQTILFNNRAHWIWRRSDIAREWMGKIKNKHPTISSFETIIIPTDDKEIKVALRDGEAFRQLYNDATIDVLFSSTAAL